MKKVEAGKVAYFIDDYVSSKLYTQKYVDNKNKVINDLLKRISDLEFEVERLEKDNKKFINTIKVVNNECNNLFNHLTKEDLDYKSRIDKAIEYIEIQQKNI